MQFRFEPFSEQKNKELQVKLDIAEQDATVSKRKETKLLEGHIKELEAELRSEQVRTLESVQIARKLERKFKEFKYVSDRLFFESSVYVIFGF